MKEETGQVVQVISRRELARRIAKAAKEQRCDERRFRKAWRKAAGQKGPLGKAWGWVVHGPERGG